MAKAPRPRAPKGPLSRQVSSHRARAKKLRQLAEKLERDAGVATSKADEAELVVKLLEEANQKAMGETT